jgi:hypothetical protein
MASRSWSHQSKYSWIESFHYCPLGLRLRSHLGKCGDFRGTTDSGTIRLTPTGIAEIISPFRASKRISPARCLVHSHA